MFIQSFISRFSLTLCCFVCFIAAACSLQAQHNALKFTPLQPLIGKVSFSYERAVSSHFSLMVEWQEWFEERNSSTTLIFPILLASASEVSTNHGHRLGLYARYYPKTVLKGGFLEGGVYKGKHNITRTTDTSVLVFWEEPKTERFPRVNTTGVRVGGGWQRTRGKFTWELSGGISFNHHSEDVATSLGMQPLSPYSRMALGLRF